MHQNMMRKQTAMIVLSANFKMTLDRDLVSFAGKEPMHSPQAQLPALSVPRAFINHPKVPVHVKSVSPGDFPAQRQCLCANRAHRENMGIALMKLD